MALRNYPTSKPSSALATGRLFYEFLIRNIKFCATVNHNLWYKAREEELKHPEASAFRGDIPVGSTIDLLTLGGKPIEGASESGASYTFTGEESYVLVSDLTEKARRELGIPAGVRDKDKVFNPNFRPYEGLPQFTQDSNELAALSVPKSTSSYLCATNVNYSEKDVLGFLSRAFDNLSGPEMAYILHGNNMMWTALAYIRDGGNVEGDVMAEFYGQNPWDFYTKDLGTVLPAMFFALASLGEDPVIYHGRLDVEVYDADKAALFMQYYMPTAKP